MIHQLAHSDVPISILIVSATNYRVWKDQLYRFTDVTVRDCVFRLWNLNYIFASATFYRRSVTKSPSSHKVRGSPQPFCGSHVPLFCLEYFVKSIKRIKTLQHIVFLFHVVKIDAWLQPSITRPFINRLRSCIILVIFNFNHVRNNTVFEKRPILAGELAAPLKSKLNMLQLLQSSQISEDLLLV